MSMQNYCFNGSGNFQSMELVQPAKLLFMEIIFSLQVPNNYETDLIYPIIEKASELANVSYALADDYTKMNLKVCYLF